MKKPRFMYSLSNFFWTFSLVVYELLLVLNPYKLYPVTLELKLKSVVPVVVVANFVTIADVLVKYSFLYLVMLVATVLLLG